MGCPVSTPGDADWGMGITLVVTANPIAVVVADAGKPDHLPSDHLTIAAVDGIGEEALRHILQQDIEETLRIDAVEPDFTRLDPLQRVVLLSGRQLFEAGTETGPAILIEGGEPFPVEFGRRQRRCGPCSLVPLT